MMQTQLESYRLIQPELSFRQRQVYDALSRMPCTNRELTNRLGLPINSITGRVKELRDKGMVRLNGKKYDSITNREVAEWRTV